MDNHVRLVVVACHIVEAGAGGCFVPAYAPDQFTEMILNGQGEGVVYQGDKLLTRFQLRFCFCWNQFRFLMEETRSPAYFDFLPSTLDRQRERQHRIKDANAHVYRNIILVCEETLQMIGPRTGLSFVFKRLPVQYGPKP